MGLTRTLLVAGAGAALAYMFDPVSGRERRQKVRDYLDERLRVGDPMRVDEPTPTIVVEAETRRASAE
ncbi:MAG TPA: hypothetical protein VGO86_08705 [Candidatus Dormibacteraeota bacterium]|jgi:hypothetical protein